MCVAGRQHSQRSPGRAPILASEARAECSSAVALSSTPLGPPVDPEVPMTTAVPSATAFFWPERTVVIPPASSTVSGASVSTSSASLAAGSAASSGRMAGPLPSSAAASSSSSRRVAHSTRTACNWRVWGDCPPGPALRIVTIVKVRSRTWHGILEVTSDRMAAVWPGTREGLLRHPLRHRRGHREDHHQPARGAQRVPPHDLVRALARVQRRARRPGHRCDHSHRRGRHGVLLRRRPEDPRRRRLHRRSRRRPAQRSRPPGADQAHPQAGDRHGGRRTPSAAGTCCTCAAT